ncbi:MAG TPA: polysaccharide pyruvyl transferase family protein [Candidatus Cryptobacteroides sp.]|nr:polysaccharide pyruvyl transferase family protein [Candidatus Cryptobacteroides sp.]
MKRVGLVTWYRGTNYGSVLQAYALRKALENSGCKVYFLRSFNRPFTLKNIKINFFSKYRINRRNPLDDCPFPAQKERFAEFIKESFPERLPISRCGYRRMLKDTSVFMSGSDQIWNCRHNFDPFLFLDFAEDVKRVSYASSIGTGEIPAEYQSEVKSLLSGFSHIGVREKSAETALSALTGRKDIKTVLDPTFLLSAEEWQDFALASDYRNLPEGHKPLLEGHKHLPKSYKHLLKGKYIFCYFVGKASLYEEYLQKLRAISGLDHALILPSNDFPLETISGAERIEDAGPREFISLLSGADAVLTDSFHGSALSINLGKQFYCVKRFSDADPLSQNSRLYDLFSLFGIGDRFLENGEPGKIDYKAVSNRLKELRTESLSFLKKEIE